MHQRCFYVVNAAMREVGRGNASRLLLPAVTLGFHDESLGQRMKSRDDTGYLKQHEKRRLEQTLQLFSLTSNVSVNRNLIIVMMRLITQN